MKIILSLVMLMSFTAFAQNDGNFMKDTREALAIAKNCAKSIANVEVSSTPKSISSSAFETLGGEQVNNVSAIDEDERLDVVFQKSDSGEVIVLDIKIARDNQHWSLSGATHRGQSGCEQYKP